MTPASSPRRPITRRLRPLLLALSGAGLLAALLAPPAPAAYGPAELWFTFQDAAINESSGVAVSSYSDDVLFTHNDSAGTPTVFAVGADGQTLATVHVAGVGNNDWEDMARGPGSNGGTSLYIADVGDNLRARRFVWVYEVAEPVVDPDGPPGAVLTVPVVAARQFVYEDGPHDAEAVLVAPDGSLAVVTKDPHGVSGVYVPGPALPIGASLLRRVATVPVLLHAANPLDTASLQITGGDVAHDGSRVALRTYPGVLEWAFTGDFATTFAADPIHVGFLPVTMQGEAITYSRSSADLITTSEGVHAPVHRLAGI